MKNHLEIINKLKSSILKNQLPGEKAHLQMAPYRISSIEAKKRNKNPRLSAVGIHLFLNSKNKLSTILIQRTNKLPTHKGQIAFPGGKKDKTDVKLLETAKRESKEELGIENGTLIGELTPVYIPVSNFDVSPFVFFHENHPKIVQCKDEVEHYFSIEIESILNPKNIDRFDYKENGKVIIKGVPCFNIAGKIIWGATALILNELKHILS